VCVGTKLRLLLLAAVIVALGVMAWLAGNHSGYRAPPTFKFLSYTNSGGQLEALFRLDHAPRDSFSDSLTELRYLSPTGWTRPSAPAISWRFFGWDGTGSIAAISVETTNLPARVVMGLGVPREGVPGLYDRVVYRWSKFRGNSMESGRDIYVTNQTVVVVSDPR